MKEKLFEHFEKGILAICVLLMGYYIYSGFSVEPYNRSPEEFSKATSRAKEHVEKQEPDVSDLKAVNFSEVATDLTKPLDASPYQFRTKIHRHFNYGLSFRSQPKILAPTKPLTQANRGLFALFKTDPSTKKRIMRKVPKSKSQFKKEQYGLDPAEMLEGMSGMYGQYGGQEQMMMRGRAGMQGGQDSSGQMRSRYGDGSPGGMGSGGYGQMQGMMGMGSGAGAMMGSMGMYGGGEDFYPGSSRPNYNVKDSDDEDGEIEVSSEVKSKIQGRRKKRAAVLQKKEEEKKDKKDEDVLEPIEVMVGKHFVEVVATFPHSEQIKGYVKALREPARMVYLRYAMAIVERRELDYNAEWTDWHEISLVDQFLVVKNAVLFEEEPDTRIVVPGLAMNIPTWQSVYKEFLVPPELEESKVVKAVYTPEEENPMLAMPKKQTRQRTRPTRTQTTQDDKDKKDEKKSQAEPPGSAVSGKTRLGFLKEEKLKQKRDKNQPFNNRYELKDALVRFLDFTVQPGRRYQYRIKVRVVNPNFGRTDVADSEFASQPFLTGPASEPSDEVYVTPDVQWYVMKQDRRDSRAKIQGHYWDREMGEWLTFDFAHRPGDIIGFSSTVKPVNDMIFWDGEKKDWKLSESVPRDREYDADTILLDIEGGNQRVSLGGTARNFNPPREVIAVNKYGDLVRRDEFTDSKDETRQGIASWYKSLIAEYKSNKQSDTPDFGTGASRGAGLFGPAGGPAGP